VKVVVPEPAPNRVVEPVAAVTVSFGAAKTAVLLVVVMLLPPDDVSATAVAPETVTAVPEVPTTAAPEVVVAPLDTTVTEVEELK
jgi:hypothetical protein